MKGSNTEQERKHHQKRDIEKSVRKIAAAAVDPVLIGITGRLMRAASFSCSAQIPPESLQHQQEENLHPHRVDQGKTTTNASYDD